MKGFLKWMAGIFGILAVVFYFVSIQDVNGLKVANIQSTVFCAACAVICALNVVGAIIFTYLESLSSSISSLEKKSIQSDPVKNASVGDNSQNSRDKGEWTCSCGHINSSFESTCPCGKNKSEVMLAKYTPQQSATEKTAKTSDNAEWADEGNSRVKCPQCGEIMTIDFIRARKKCPKCGCEYLK